MEPKARERWYVKLPNYQHLVKAYVNLITENVVELYFVDRNGQRELPYAKGAVQFVERYAVAN